MFGMLLWLACGSADGPSDPPSSACGAEIDLGPGMVRTQGGVVQGDAAGSGWRFLGIPFAAAPIGPLRFAPPEAPPCQDTVYEASAFGPACPQDQGQGWFGDEDCLQLNVFTPDLAGQAPVLFFVHGGAHTQGSAGQGTDYEDYDGQALAEATGSVVVTTQYRLGALGFLAHPNLQASVPANAGIQDIQQALRWTQSHIASFGGDPTQVMLFGESAGSVNTCVLLSAPDSEGLFGAALMQSGACSHRTLAQAEAEAETALATLDCEGADPLSCLRAQPTEALVALNTISDTPGVVGGTGFGPVGDGEILDQDPWEALAERRMDVPLVVGSNSDETATFTPTLSETQFNALMRATFGDAHEDAHALWPLEDYSSPRWAWIDVSTHLQFTCPAGRAVAAAAQTAQAPVYQYHFSHRAEGASGAAYGAFHGLELLYVFQNLDAVADASGYDPSDRDRAVEAELGTLWATHAAGQAPWTPWRPEQPAYLHIGEVTEESEALSAARCAFVDSLE